MLVPTIGIEVHAELKTQSKVFSDSLNAFSPEPNTNVSIIDLGYPGILPELNKEVINMALKASLACNCQINQQMHFDRKNYFYPDLPKGYQITQKDTPIGYEGYIELDSGKKIRIERIHIEEDTCKSIHSSNKTLLNFNRAGVPLIEIVTHPDIASGEEAVEYLEKLREILLYIGVSDVKIEEGSMRCDANVSLREETAKALGTKTEIKNIGSITNVMLSINEEIKRQSEILNNNGLIKEQTRRYDDKTGTTILMREKETGNDYRYFPEPDIPYVFIDNEWIEKVKNEINYLPSDIRKKYRSLGVNENNIKTLISNYDLNMFYLSIIDVTNPIIGANLLTGDILSYINKNNVKINETKLNQNNFASLIKLLEENTISSKQAKEIVPILLEKGMNPNQIIEELGLKQISDTSELETIVKQIINEHPESVEDFKQGKDKAVKFLMGQIMKETHGQANPVVVSNLLIDNLKKL